MKVWIWAPVRGSPPLSQGPHALLDPACLLEGLALRARTHNLHSDSVARPSQHTSQGPLSHPLSATTDSERRRPSKSLRWYEKFKTAMPFSFYL